jgi:hypothetical protein
VRHDLLSGGRSGLSGADFATCELLLDYTITAKEENMPSKKGRAWKLERASVHLEGGGRPRSNKYSASDHDQVPAPGTRSRVWVGGYTRTDGRKVRGHYRSLARVDEG